MGFIKKHSSKFLMIVAALLSATGQLFWKLGFEEFIYMVIGFICYGLGAVLMIKAFSNEKFSVAYPLLCLSYVFALFYGDIFFSEPISTKQILAVILISLGVILTSYDK